jgi:hypothetical protein
MRYINRGFIGVAMLAALTACGGGGSFGGSGSSTSTSSGSGNNNTPPGIANAIVFVGASTSAPSGTTISAASAATVVVALQGAGGNTNADVIFEVDDASGAGVSGIPVKFALITNTGDATLTTTTGTTDKNGRASTFVVSGNVHETVTVQATVDTPSGVKTADSNALAITTGIPTQGNFGIAVTSLTAPNADDTLGVTDTVTVQLSDRFSNPAPDGTAVSFFANQGQIQGQCFTAGGSCNVKWTSSGRAAIADTYHETGQVEILAYTVGEESFTDVDGDGVFDNSDKFTTGGNDAFSGDDPSSDDIGEVYLDGAGSGSYLAGDFFYDFDKSLVRTGPDGKFYGFGCKGTSTVPCGSTTTRGIGKEICINMSSSTALVVISDGGTGALNPATGVFTVATAGTTPLTFTVSDINKHALGAGTTVSLVTSGLNGFTVNAPANIPYTFQDEGCGNFSVSFPVTIVPVSPAPTGTLTGSLVLKITTTGSGGHETDTPTITLQ